MLRFFCARTIYGIAGFCCCIAQCLDNNVTFLFQVLICSICVCLELYSGLAALQ